MNTRNIIIIDDDPVFCFILQKLFKSQSITDAKSFNIATEAVALIEKESNANSRFFIFLDLNMPVMSGWEFLDHIQAMENAPEIEVVIVTSSVDPRDLEKATKYSNVKELIKKPITGTELSRVLKKYAQIELCKG
jgi:CheY-like chemotaxis protein